MYGEKATLRLGLALTAAAAALAPVPEAAAAAVTNPYPRARLGSEALAGWEFERGAEGWSSLNACELDWRGGRLAVKMTGHDPYFALGDLAGRGLEGPLVVVLRARSSGVGDGAVYWATTAAPHTAESMRASFPMNHDQQWREYRVPLPVEGRLSLLRLDPGSGAGHLELDWVRVERERYHPLEIGRIVVDAGAGEVSAKVTNRGAAWTAFRSGGDTYSHGPGESVVIRRPLTGGAVIETVTIKLSPADPGAFPPLERTAVVHHPEVATPGGWLALEAGDLVLHADPAGSGARLLRRGEVVAVLAPLAADAASGQPIAVRGRREGEAIVFAGGAVESMVLGLGRGELRFRLRVRKGATTVSAPVVRAVGDLEQGLFAGVEHLGRGEPSSSDTDLTGPDHVRFAPDPLWVTMPLMATVTGRGSVALAWDRPSPQPVFATPNFFDGTADHRIALRANPGTRVSGAVWAGPGWGEGGRLAGAILWLVKRRGLPPLPHPPRDRAEQAALCLAGLNGPLRTAEGWGHCVEERWGRRFFADHASTHWRLTGELPDLVAGRELVPGGAHIRNPAAFFLTGQAGRWRDHLAAAAARARRDQRPDGSYRYGGKFRRGHFEDTASGVVARPAFTLLEHAAYTGDKASLEAGLRALTFLERFRTPRGAQTWEVPLHTPDILASAHAVRAHVLAHHLTGDREHLAQARLWALRGVPFVYLWDDGRPVMRYATIAVLGATNWTAPVWIGLPVQWCGLDYAYALLDLAPHDDTLDWRHLAEGILLAGEQMQYPDGPHAGLLPDSFNLHHQERRPYDINPCALVSLRLRLAGKLDGLDLAISEDGQHRAAAPFPVTLEGDDAIVTAPRGARYQVLVNGGRVVEVERSTGRDRVELGPR